MTVDKKINYEVQGGIKNYLGKQKQVQAPVKWKSSPNHPETELAYITKAEKDLLVKKDLHGSLKGGVNRGPSGIMSLNGFGSADESQNVSGSQMSAAETGNSSGFSGTGGGPELPPGVTQKPDQTAQDIRNAFINAGGGQRVNPGFFDSSTFLSPEEQAQAKDYRNDPNNIFANQSYRNTGQGGIMNMIKSGGFMGNLVKQLGQRFGFGKKYDDTSTGISANFNNNLGLDGINPATYDFNPDEKISNTSFSQEPTFSQEPARTSAYNIGDNFFTNNPEVRGMMRYGLTETKPYGNPNIFNSYPGDISPEFQDLVTRVGINDKQKSIIDKKALMYGNVNANFDGTKGLLDETTQKEIFDAAKLQDTKAKSGFLGSSYGEVEEDPMLLQEYNKYIKSKGYI